MSSIKKTRVDLAATAAAMFGRTELSKPEVIKLIEAVGAVQKPGYIWKNKTPTGYYDVAGENTDKYGTHTVISHTGWNLGMLGTAAGPTEEKPAASSEDAPAPTEKTFYTQYIPTINPLYIKDGNFRTFTKVMESGRFFTVWVTGESGIGKTLGIEQAAAQLGKEIIRVNLTEETTERHLIGSLGLVVKDGASATEWKDGPVLTAMKRGSLLLLDEVDIASTKILCMQSIMEGGNYVNPHTNEVVVPQPGFNIFGTANTNGQMSARTNKFIGAKPMNEAFLDRWAITVRHTAPSTFRVLEQFATVNVADYATNDEVKYIVEDLAEWTDQTRAQYDKHEMETFITTRRVVGVLDTFLLFGNVEKAMQLTLARFDENEREALVSFWKVIASDRSEKLARNEVAVASDSTEVDGSLAAEEDALGEYLNNL